MTVDQKYHGKLTPEKVRNILDSYREDAGLPAAGREEVALAK